MILNEYEKRITSDSKFYSATIELVRILKYTNDPVDMILGTILLPWSAIVETICLPVTFIIYCKSKPRKV